MRSDARVTDVAAPFHVSPNAISKHICVLDVAGLVRRRVAGCQDRPQSSRHFSSRFDTGQPGTHPR
jgi:predicted ArsR family transcriptional regulator